MTRLIAFGDSFTYGHGLSDCHVAVKKSIIMKTEYDLPGPNPSKFAWPQVLGDKLNLEVINKSICGSSNIKILKEILIFNFLPTDLVIIGWTFILRDHIFNKNIFGVESENRMSPWHKNTNIVKKYYDIHNDYDLAVRSGLYIHHAEMYLKTKEVTQYHFSALNHGWYNTDKVPVFIKQPEYVVPGQIINHNTDTALDNSHPGPLSHKHAAEKLYEIVNESK